MKIDTLRLKPTWQDYNFEFDKTKFARLIELNLASEIKAHGLFRLLIQNRRIKLKASYKAQLKRPCDLCLELTELKLDDEFSISLLPDDDQEFSSSQQLVNSDNADLDSYQGRYIFLDKYLEDQLILELSPSFYCRDDCRGLCTSCGINLNYESCACSDKLAANIKFKNAGH